MFIAVESGRDQNQALIDAGAQKCQYLQALLVELWRCLKYYPYLIHSSQDMVHYDVNRASYDY